MYTLEARARSYFLDTPGIHKAKNKLGEYMVNVAEQTLTEVDVDALARRADRLHRDRRAAHLQSSCKKSKTPVILDYE